MYKEIKPSKAIDYVIDTFWTFSKNKSAESFKVLPDTCTDLIFDLNRNMAFLSGAMTQYQSRELMTDSEIIGVRFKIEKFSSLSKTPLHYTKNLRVELNEIISSKHLEPLNGLGDFEKIEHKINFLENFIGTLHRQNFHNQEQMVLSSSQNIRSLKGIVNVKELATSHHIGLRQFERRFKSFMGLTVKEFSNIVRFNNAKQSIESLSKSSLLEIAFNTGFFDHSHMTNEFKRISGQNPSSFRECRFFTK